MFTKCLRLNQVLGAGLEPARPQWSLDFKSNVSTNSTIRAVDERKTAPKLRGNPPFDQGKYYKITQFFNVNYFKKNLNKKERKTGFEPATLTLAR